MVGHALAIILLAAVVPFASHGFVVCPTRTRTRTAHMQWKRFVGETQAEKVFPDQQTLSEVLATAVRAASEAGGLIRKNVGANVIKTKSNSKDLLTEVDAECQRVVESIVLSEFPGHSILGEETVAPGAVAARAALEQALLTKEDTKGDSEDSNWLWIVDPIDGTTNFVHGMPLSAVSIGVTYRGQLVVGCIFDPFHNELFTATLGYGAYLNGMRISVGDEGTLEEATVAAGAPPTALSLAPCVRGIVALAPLVRTTRMIGSAAIMLAWVACGRLTCYWEPDLNAWDTAAGALLITEAGGCVTDIEGGVPYTVATRPIIGSNTLVHEAVREVLVSAEATRPDTM